MYKDKIIAEVFISCFGVLTFLGIGKKREEAII
jgi:hypothetical protein